MIIVGSLVLAKYLTSSSLARFICEANYNFWEFMIWTSCPPIDRTLPAASLKAGAREAASLVA
jgi:hypothetical protein